MPTPLNVLIVEDNDDDARLIVAELERDGWDVAWERVETREQMSAALDRSLFDLIVSDYHLPRFSAPHALAVHRERGLDVPFLVVSATVGDEQAVDVLKAGAHDFCLKDRMARFCVAVRRELRETEARRTLRRVQQEREAAVRLFEDLFESAPDATVIVDREGSVRAANLEAARMFGYAREELVGLPVENLMPEAHRADHARHRTHFLERPSARAMGAGRPDLVALRRDGTVFPVEISLSPLHSRPGSVVASLRDVTERRELETQLRQAQKIEAVGRLAGGVAHDFNNILGVILGHANLLLRDLPGQRARERVEQVASAAERAANLTRQLLAFSRRQVFLARVVDLNRTVGGLVQMLERLVGEDVEVVFRPAAAGRVRADVTQLEQALMNLAVNARDAMPAGGRLTIETSDAELDEAFVRAHAGARPGRYLRIAVADTGQGMTPEVKARAFEPFFTTKETGRGTGLGLATTYGIVKQSGGFIYLESEPGRGTTFEIYLPSVDEPPQAEEKQPAPEPGSETVLLAEDEAGLRDVIREFLEDDGYRVLSAESPEAAIELARGHAGPIHLLLTDVVMPRISGSELARQVQSLRPRARVLYMSGHADETIAQQGVLRPGAALLAKPFSRDALARKVREVLGPARTYRA
jgi:PAS domain S-box-containing protein